MTEPLCDPETGACILPSAQDLVAPNAATTPAIYYVGDPMCSWCWGMSGEIDKLARYCANNGIGFRIVMGGLRAGGGDPWNAPFKKFLRDEWQHIGAATGQPFSFKILDRPFFNYDTEPACRAVATARAILNDETKALEFFASVQRKFYDDGEDPKDVEFYRDICARFDLEYDEFRSAFESRDAKAEVLTHFKLTRELGVRGFPSVVARTESQTTQLAAGYRKFADIKASIETVIETGK